MTQSMVVVILSVMPESKLSLGGEQQRIFVLGYVVCLAPLCRIYFDDT